MTSISKRIDLQSLITQRNEFIAIADGVLANIERMSTGDKVGAHAIGPRIVLIESHGRPTDAQVRDIESVVYHVMGATVPHEDIRLNLRGWFPHGVHGQPIMENEYMRLRKFKNGNVHVTWTDEGKVAVERMNDVLALGAERSLGRAGGK